MITTGNPSAKLGKTRAAGRLQLLAYPMAPLEAGDPDPAVQAVLVDEPFDLAAKRAVPYQDEVEVEAAIPEPRRGLDQQELALLFGQPAHAHQPRPIRHGHGGRRQEILVQAAVNHVDLAPVLQAHQRLSWPRVNSLMAATKSACRIFSSSASRVGRSNSPGPWIVKL